MGCSVFATAAAGGPAHRLASITAAPCITPLQGVSAVQHLPSFLSFAKPHGEGEAAAGGTSADGELLPGGAGASDGSVGEERCGKKGGGSASHQHVSVLVGVDASSAHNGGSALPGQHDPPSLGFSRFALAPRPAAAVTHAHAAAADRHSVASSRQDSMYSVARSSVAGQPDTAPPSFAFAKVGGVGCC